MESSEILHEANGHESIMDIEYAMIARFIGAFSETALPDTLEGNGFPAYLHFPNMHKMRFQWNDVKTPQRMSLWRFTYQQDKS